MSSLIRFKPHPGFWEPSWDLRHNFLKNESLDCNHEKPYASLGLFSRLDINECDDVSKNNCSINAHCNNTDGNYNCSCYDGYNGDGFQCDGEPMISSYIQKFLSQFVL